MSVSRVRVQRDTYVDSVLLMSVTRAMEEVAGVAFASAVMGTEANREELVARGVEPGALAEVRANDLVLAVVADDPGAAEDALEAAQRRLAGERPPRAEGAARAPRTLDEAVELLPGANLALVSVPGPYAAIEAHKALSRGLHVLLFSDNVPLEDEIALKRRAADLGLLVMGPGAGTAWIAGVGLGFANAVLPGAVGIVAAAGTGAQECMALLDRWGQGVSAVIGVGGRDLSAEVGGLMARAGIRALVEDGRTEVLLLVSKPPGPAIARDVLGSIELRPAVAALVGLGPGVDAPEGVVLARTLEEGVRRTIEALGAPAPPDHDGLAARAEAAARALPAERRAVRGLFSGGTLCSEALVLLGEHLGPVHSNTTKDPRLGLPAPPAAHVCVDMGEEEFTRGRPHPMIDPEPRAERIALEAQDPTVAVILLDVVLGYGAHPDPAGVLAPACREAVDAGVAVVAHVVGTERDPQGLAGQERALQEAGCILAPTSARAALLAAAVALRRPELAEARP
ncbi:MAG TPA: protein FdrA [Actinomycetota bacterium]|nr:protein FdrA [Actinomycetota bacterium]